MIKKVTFLEGLRKALRNRNSTAAYCLISLLRAARHFRLDSDSALLSYALDVQDEVREAVFRRYTPGVDSTSFDDSLMTAAFVTLAHLNFDMCHQSLAPLCLSANAPEDFKVAYISACCYFARQQNVDVYQPLFAKASSLVRSHLKVRSQPSKLRNIINSSRGYLSTAKVRAQVIKMHNQNHQTFPH
jgi:neurofibromin 1